MSYSDFVNTKQNSAGIQPKRFTARLAASNLGYVRFTLACFLNNLVNSMLAGFYCSMNSAVVSNIVTTVTILVTVLVTVVYASHSAKIETVNCL
jgi:hypothetical protein